MSENKRKDIEAIQILLLVYHSYRYHGIPVYIKELYIIYYILYIPVGFLAVIITERLISQDLNMLA